MPELDVRVLRCESGDTESEHCRNRVDLKKTENTVFKETWRIYGHSSYSKTIRINAEENINSGIYYGDINLGGGRYALFQGIILPELIVVCCCYRYQNITTADFKVCFSLSLK